LIIFNILICYAKKEIREEDFKTKGEETMPHLLWK